MKKIVNGIEVSLTKNDILEIEIKELEYLEEKKLLEKTKYKRDRAKEYPPIEDQLDIIYHEGIDAWKLKIKTIKDKYPKPEDK